MNRLAACTAAVLFAAAVLPACGKDPLERVPLRVNARSGAKVDLSSTTWQTCLADTPSAGKSVLSRIVHGEQGAVTYAFQEFAAPGCTGTTPGVVSQPFVAFVDGERAATWSGTPPADALSPPVPASPIVTRVFLSAQGVATDVFWLDDVASPRVLYAGATNSPTTAGYPDLLFSGGWPEVR